jgi:3-methyl-2-oxobutanoate hydroxymethyltransferase
MTQSNRVTVPDIRRMKGVERITVLTAYDYLTARILDRAGIEIILVGDSLGMVFQGQKNTLPVTLEEIIYHTRAVARGVERALVVSDMPFLSFQVSEAEAVRNAGRCLKEGGAHAVKIEGGVPMASLVRRLNDIGIPVMGHVGLTPQSEYKLGGFKIQGKNRDQALALIEDARALDEAGAFSIVIESVPEEVAGLITESVSVL